MARQRSDWVSGRLVERLERGGVAVGLAHTVRDEFVSEMVGRAGFDFVVIDQQHAPIEVETLQRLLIGLFPTNTAALVRPTHNDATAIGQALDLGAAGVIVPMVNSAEDARRAVLAARYPPEGMRSWGPRRAMRIAGGRDEYASGANTNALVFVQIETREAVDNLDAILTEPGLSGAMIGPADLAASLGFLHDRGNPTVDDAMLKVLHRCQDHGLPFGTFSGNIANSELWIKRGATLVVAGIDVEFIAQGMERTLDGVRPAAESRQR